MIFFGKPVSTFPDHALGRKHQEAGTRKMDDDISGLRIMSANGDVLRR
jgi:hypothetical protein